MKGYVKQTFTHHPTVNDHRIAGADGDASAVREVLLIVKDKVESRGYDAGNNRMVIKVMSQPVIFSDFNSASRPVTLNHVSIHPGCTELETKVQVLEKSKTKMEDEFQKIKTEMEDERQGRTWIKEKLRSRFLRGERLRWRTRSRSSSIGWKR